ncbi:hypothetical protein G7054_g4683 [Neopestalotiopsis clavispora]|nr:hypothetical protein G7054_g4683 [Neopestalotiopsis clavispora]
MYNEIRNIENFEQDYIPPAELARTWQDRCGVSAIPTTHDDMDQAMLEHFGQMPLINSLPVPPRPPTPSPAPRPGPVPPRPGPTPPPSP